jgi:hypothetical protein
MHMAPTGAIYLLAQVLFHPYNPYVHALIWPHSLAGSASTTAAGAKTIKCDSVGDYLYSSGKFSALIAAIERTDLSEWLLDDDYGVLHNTDFEGGTWFLPNDKVREQLAYARTYRCMRRARAGAFQGQTPSMI